MARRLIQALNIGSSSLKISLFSIEENKLIRILDLEGLRDHKKGSIEKTYHQLACKLEEHIDADSSLVGIGYRFIHGGPKYISSTVLHPKELKELEKLKDLAPLHNPDCLKLIRASMDRYGEDIKHVAIFDTAFHRSLPREAEYYPIPKKFSDKYQIKHYGFHGISHAFLVENYFTHTKENKKPSRLITVHLGSGCSLAAIKDGYSVDTSMGFSPAEGLMMGTRAGDLDYTLIEFLSKKMNKPASHIIHMFNFDSGLKGVSGKTADVKVLLKHYGKNQSCTLAIDMFCYRIVKYIGAYFAALGGADALIFSGGIGENAPFVRKNICAQLKALGMTISDRKNKAAVHLPFGGVRQINTPSSLKIYVMATDENIYIGKEVMKKLPEIA